MRSATKTWLGFSAALSVAFGAASAGAHGGIPRVTGIHFEPGKPGRSVLAMEAFGLLDRGAADEPFRFVCADAFGLDSNTVERKSVAVLRGGTTVVAGAFDGLQISRDGGCNFSRHPTLDGDIVSHVAASPDGRTLYVVAATASSTSDGGVTIDGRIYRSDDDARTFVAVGAPLPTNFAPHTFAVAPSRPTTVYVAGGVVNADMTLVVSHDSGETWAYGATFADADDAFEVHITVSPSRPEDVVVSCEHRALGSEILPETIWHSRDGGASLNLLFQGEDDLAGLAFSLDASTLTFGGAKDGLWTVALGGDGPLAPVQISTRRTWGLAWTQAGLFMGLDAFGPTADPEVDKGDALGISTDHGATMMPTVSLCDVRPPACKPTDGARASCGAAMNHLFNDYFAAACAPAEKEPWYGILDPAPGGNPGGDAGAPNAAAGDDELRIESGCSVGNARGKSGAGAVMGLVLGAATLRRRRSLLRPWSEPPSR